MRWSIVTLRAVTRAGLLLAVALIAGGLLWAKYYPRAPAPATLTPARLRAPSGSHHDYSTNFARAENPISEGEKWLGGKAVGLDWSDVAALPGLAHGTESGTAKGDKAYDDSTALLSGAWRPDQSIEATVYIANERHRDFQEVELRLRSTLTGHESTGYEILFRCLKDSQSYATIARWNGKLGDFTYLVQEQGMRYGVSNGDVVKATIIKNVITAYVNGVPLLRATDDTYSSGSPGIGFWLKRPSGWRTWFQIQKADSTDCGFSSVVAWD